MTLGDENVSDFKELSHGFVGSLRVLAALYLTALALFAVGSIVMATIGVWPWISITVPGWALPVPAGVLLHLCAGGLALSLLFYLPSALKVMQLDHAHRRFEISMEDVAKAYSISHAADRAGAFTMSSEFDAVRERMLFLKEHPDLGSLEPGIIDVAAQMSVVSHERADVYSEEKVARVRTVLRQRQNEIMELQDRLARARKITDELKRWMGQVDVERAIAETQIAQLTADLEDILPELEDAVRAEALPAPQPQLATVTPMKRDQGPAQKVAE